MDLCFYYVWRGSHVFCAFIDFYKAFDNVDYWLVFCNLVNKASDTPRVYVLTDIANRQCIFVGTVVSPVHSQSETYAFYRHFLFYIMFTI